MGFPIRKGTGPFGTDTWNGTSGSISYTTASGTPASGDLVLLWIAKDDDVAPDLPTDGGSAFTSYQSEESNNNMWGALFIKIANGSEGSSISWGSDSEEGVAILTVIDGGSLQTGTLADVDSNSQNPWSGVGTAIDAYNTTPDWGTDGDTLYIAYAGWDSNSVVSSWATSDYPDDQTSVSSSTGAGAAGGAAATYSSDGGVGPGIDIVVLDDAEEWEATTIAIRGATPTLGYLPNAPTPSLRDTTPPTATDDSTTISINKPDNTADGDLLVAVINFDAEGTARTFSSTG